jgi:hypothetical protein
VQWKRGAHADAVVWLRRAAEAALGAGETERASELNQAAAQLTEQMLDLAPDAQASSRPPENANDVDALLSGALPGRLSAPMLSIPIDVEVEEISHAPVGADTERSMSAASPVTPPPLVSTRGGAAPRPPPAPSALRPPPPPRAARPRPPMPSAPSFVTSAPELDDVLERRRPKSTLAWSPTEAAAQQAATHQAFPRPPSAPPPITGAEPDPEPEFDDTQASITDEAHEQRQPETLVAPPPEAGYSDSDTTALTPGVDDMTLQDSDFPPSAEQEAAQPLTEPPYEPGASRMDSEPTLQDGSLVPAPLPTEAPASAAGPETAKHALPEPVGAEASIGGISLSQVPGLQDLPEDAQHALVASVRLETLMIDEEVTNFGIALVIEGWVTIMPTIADSACAHAQKGEVVFTAGTLPDSIGLRVVSGQDDTLVAVWDSEALEQATQDCPWVADELRVVADRYQALAGVTMGAMGDRLDDSLRALVTDRCQVKTLLPYEVLVERGHTLPGLHIVGGGRIEIIVETEDGTGEVADELGPGDFLFAPQVLGGSPASATARAGAGGALVLFADRMTTHELLVSVPPMLELLAG